MGPVLGVEGGGAHTHTIVVDTSGSLLGAGANHDPANWDDVGISAAGAAIRSCVVEALEQAGTKPEAIAASVLALGGVDFPMDEQRLGGIPAAIGLGEPCSIVNDAFAALRAGTDEPFGVVVVASNGTVVAGRNREGEIARSLGMGPMFGDFGSLTDLSQAAVSAIAEAYLDRGPQTTLTDLLCGLAGAGSVVEFIEGVARLRIDPVAFAPTIIQAAEDGDEVAAALLAGAGRALGETTAHVVRRLGMLDGTFDLVLTGEMFDSSSTRLVDELVACVQQVAPDVRIQHLEEPSVVGAALLAIELAGETPPPGARAALGSELGASLGRATF